MEDLILIDDNLTELITALKKEGIYINNSDIQYQFQDRTEHLFIDSDLIYPGLDIPANFGVYRSYAGGGMHSALKKTEVYKLPANRQAKALRLLNIFERYFWSILEDFSALESEEVAEWESVLI